MIRENEKKENKEKNIFSFLSFDWEEKREERKCDSIKMTILIIVLYNKKKKIWGRKKINWCHKLHHFSFLVKWEMKIFSSGSHSFCFFLSLGFIWWFKRRENHFLSHFLRPPLLFFHSLAFQMNTKSGFFFFPIIMKTFKNLHETKESKSKWKAGTRT